MLLIVGCRGLFLFLDAKSKEFHDVWAHCFVQGMKQHETKKEQCQEEQDSE